MKLFKKIFFTGSIFLAALVFISPQLLAQSTSDSASIRNLLEERDQEIKELMGPKGTEYTEEQRSKLKDIINGIIDYRSMAQYALQETYDTISVEQREEFVDLFSTIIRDHSLSQLDIYRAEVTYQEIDTAEDSAVVHTLAELENVRTPVVYKMENIDGQWVVTDMDIDDVSTADSYRRQFQNIIRKKGFDTLLETLRKRANS